MKTQHQNNFYFVCQRALCSSGTSGSCYLCILRSRRGRKATYSAYRQTNWSWNWQCVL